MINMFAAFGLGILLFGVIVGITAFIGWIVDDDDNTMRWLVTSLLADVLLTMFIFKCIM
jgi:hypothetical protein